MAGVSSQSSAPSFVPCNSVLLITSLGVQTLSHSEITPEVVGQKAYGLSCVPLPWVPQFCVIGHNHAIQLASNISPDNLRSYLAQIPWFAKLDAKAKVMIRSSAVDETIDERGSLLSETTEIENLLIALSQCVKDTSTHNKIIHWIIQPFIQTKLKGHLSNERRVALAKRDWIVDFEVIDHSEKSPSPIPLAIRRWRHGDIKPPSELECASSISIDQILRNPAQWATENKFRVHFEWVWDGATVWLVQADLCASKDGISPHSTLPKHVTRVRVEDLHHFRVATQNDFDSYRKLSNANLYATLGYELPLFYVLETRDVIEELIQGAPRQSMLEDISKLASHPLVIRTDGKDLPPEKQQMLPRSDGLGSVEAVLEWFKTDLPKELIAFSDCHEKLIFICHHFIPAFASAWSMAEPSRRVVRVEALWGIPEGMYWYSHDAFEIDTAEIQLAKAVNNKSKFRYSRRERYKEWFIAPDSQGAWRAYRTCEPFDWKATILEERWLSEMAITSRRIAEQLGYPVNVMWFLGVHPESSKHEIIPWFHERSELDRHALRVAPRFKQANSKHVELRTMNDWEALKARSTTEQKSVKRITVSPRDPNLIRNKEFLDDLADFAKRQEAVIELNGGVLSHVFYILQRAGCIVEIVDLFGAVEESLVFKKVVRDKIPDAIEQKGEVVTQLKIKGEELISALKTKLIEEAIEVMDTKSTTDTIEELADVLEVVHALAHHLKISMKSVEEARKTKREMRGGFNEGKVLVKTAAPTSLSETSFEEDLPQKNLFESDIYVEAGTISLEPEIRLHQDEREVSGGRARLLEIELPVILSNTVVKSTEFQIIAASKEGELHIPLIGEWSITRKNSELKIRLLIKPFPIQSKLPFNNA